MCGRYTLKSPPNSIAKQFRLFDVPELKPRYNIAPSQPVLAVVQNKETSKRQARMFRWGLIPSWAKDPTIGNRMINARSETAASKLAFRSAFRHRRCLIVADGFYEWQKQGKAKQPYYIHRPNDQPMAVAGLWEHWHSEKDETIESCTILTTNANDLLKPIHDRMPVILPASKYDQWLDPDSQDPTSLDALLRPCPDQELAAYPVSRIVNSPANDSPDCIAEVDS